MRHEMFPGSARQKSEKEIFQEIIAVSEDILENSDYGEIRDFDGISTDITCTKERVDNANDRYIFVGNGMKLVLVHDRTNNLVIEPYEHPEIDPADHQASEIKEIEDLQLALYKAALEERLGII